MAASKRANGVPSALVARQSLNDEELVRPSELLCILMMMMINEITMRSKAGRKAGIVYRTTQKQK